MIFFISVIQRNKLKSLRRSMAINQRDYYEQDEGLHRALTQIGTGLFKSI